jgi:hypothetical protein
MNDKHDFPPNLSEDDDEFIYLAEIILYRLRRLKREERPSLFQRIFKSKSKSRKKPNKLNEYYLTTHELEDFKLAILDRLDDENSMSVFIDTVSSCPIPSLISSVIRYVDLVGWPKTDDSDVVGTQVTTRSNSVSVSFKLLCFLFSDALVPRLN